MDGQQVKIIEDLRSLMAYHQALGIEYYPQEAGSLQLVEKMAESPVGLQVVVPPRKVSPTVSETLQGINAEINDCCLCDLHAGRLAPVPGRGRPQARLLIVGGWLTVPEQAVLSPETIFGLEEDQMLARMLAAIHLAPEDVFVTNILKCGLPASSQPVAANIQCCLAYLRRQIVVITPELICCMGTIATRALLDLPQSLSQLRGRFHSYTTLDGRQIPLIPTYHPSYLLQAIEMKSETWKDLQLIEKKLTG